MGNMIKENLLRIIGSSESEKMEWKPSLSQVNEIIEAISAFSNTEGGKIIIGISNSGKVLGVEVGKDKLEKLTNNIHQSLDPKIHPRITVEKAKKKNIIVIEVRQSLDKLLLAFGRAFKRVGRSTVRMSKDEYERLILEKHKDKLQFDRQICRRAKLGDIDNDKVKLFLKKARLERNLDINPKIQIKEILHKLDLLEQNKPTNAAILLFGRNPQRFILQAELRCVRFKGNKPVKPFIDMKIFNGNMIEQIDKALGFVLEHVPMGVYLAGKPEREEKYAYPPDALREAIVNAVCHRDYTGAGHVQIRIFDDRIEVWNPGLLPEPLTLEDLKRKHKSIPRNPLIAKCFFLIKLIEQWGTGTNDMVNLCLKWGLPEPLFEYVSGDFVVTFRSELTEERMERLGLNPRQIKAIEYIKEYGKINRMEYIKLNEVSNATAKRDLRELIVKNMLKSRGVGPKIHYILSRYEPV